MYHIRQDINLRKCDNQKVSLFGGKQIFSTTFESSYEPNFGHLGQNSNYSHTQYTVVRWAQVS